MVIYLPLFAFTLYFRLVRGASTTLLIMRTSSIPLGVSMRVPKEYTSIEL